MSTPATDTLPSTVSGELTTALIPTVTKIDTRLDVNPILVVLAVSVACILSPITVTGNSIILAAFYRYKRLRTASNYLLISLAVSDFGVSVRVIFLRRTNGALIFSFFNPFPFLFSRINNDEIVTLISSVGSFMKMHRKNDINVEVAHCSSRLIV